MYFYYLNETNMLTHSIHYTTGNGKKQSLYRKFRIASDGRAVCLIRGTDPRRETISYGRIDCKKESGQVSI